MMTYLLIYDTGEAFTATEISETNMQEFDIGTLDIFDISQPHTATRLDEDLNWCDVPEQDE